MNRTATHRFHNPFQIDSLPWSCDFGSDVNTPDWCQIVKDRSDELGWIATDDETPTSNTGPKTFDGRQYYLMQ